MQDNSFNFLLFATKWDKRKKRNIFHKPHVEKCVANGHLTTAIKHNVT